MARKEGIAREKKKKEGGEGDEKKPIKVNTVLSVFKDEKVPINVWTTDFKNKNKPEETSEWLFNIFIKSVFSGSN